MQVVHFIMTGTDGRLGAWPAGREEGEYGEYLIDEQRRGAGCPAADCRREYEMGH